MTTRFKQVGLAGRKDAETNSADSFLKTIEVPITVVASAAEQDSGVALPDGGVQAVSAFLKIDVPEATGLTKTVSCGVFGGSGAEFLSAADVSVAGVAGDAVTAAVNTSGSTVGYTLGSADFVELEAVLVLTITATG